MPQDTLIEVAVETVDHARRAAADGAQRLELCTDLSVGGITPSAQLMREVRAAVDLPIHVLIRTRGGDFVYRSDEVAAMCREVEEARRVGIDGVAVGALTRDGVVDREAIEALRDAAGPLALIAHRAVDVARDVSEAVEVMTSLGVRRVLTSGGAPAAAEGIPRLRELVERFADRVTILAGGSVRASNVRDIVEQAGAREVHLGFPPNAESDRVRAVVAALNRRSH